MEGQRASLQDVINYIPEQYFSEDELNLIRNTFRGNSALFKVLRKVFIPTISDPELPIEKFGDDFFLSGRQYASIPENEIKSIVLAREEALKFIVGGLIQLKNMSNTKVETDEQIKTRLKKDSVK